MCSNIEYSEEIRMEEAFTKGLGFKVMIVFLRPRPGFPVGELRTSLQNERTDRKDTQYRDWPSF